MKAPNIHKHNIITTKIVTNCNHCTHHILFKELPNTLFAQIQTVQYNQYHKDLQKLC